MRLHRERRRRGLRCISVEIFDREIDELIRRGLLQPEQRGDKNSILKAVHAVFEQALAPSG
jgi:hypothetical protein